MQSSKAGHVLKPKHDSHLTSAFITVVTKLPTHSRRSLAVSVMNVHQLAQLGSRVELEQLTTPRTRIAPLRTAGDLHLNEPDQTLRGRVGARGPRNSRSLAHYEDADNPLSHEGLKTLRRHDLLVDLDGDKISAGLKAIDGQRRTRRPGELVPNNNPRRIRRVVRVMKRNLGLAPSIFPDSNDFAESEQTFGVCRKLVICHVFSSAL
jgi:hypothetical protein